MWIGSAVRQAALLAELGRGALTRRRATGLLAVLAVLAELGSGAMTPRRVTGQLAARRAIVRNCKCQPWLHSLPDILSHTK